MVTAWRLSFFQNKPNTWWRKKKGKAWRLLQTLDFKRRKGNTKHFPKKTERTSVENVRISYDTSGYTREKSHTYAISAANRLTKDRSLKGTRLHTLEKSRGYANHLTKDPISKRTRGYTLERSRRYVMSAVCHLTENGVLNYTNEHTLERNRGCVMSAAYHLTKNLILKCTSEHTPERSHTGAKSVRKPSRRDQPLWYINGDTPEKSLSSARYARRPSLTDHPLWGTSEHIPERSPTSVISVERHFVNDPIFYVIIGPTPKRWPPDQCDNCKKIWGLRSSPVYHAKHKNELLFNRESSPPLLLCEIT